MVKPEESSAADEQQQQQQQQPREEAEQNVEPASEADSQALLPKQQQQQQQQQQQESVPMVEIKTQSESADAAADVNDASTIKKADAAVKEQFVGLTKDELEKFAKDPFWRKVRVAVFLLFWFVWFAMLAAVVAIIVVSPKCPPRPERHFWQEPFYRIQIRSFAPSSKSSNKLNKTGTLTGIELSMDYLRDDLGFNNFILSSLVANSYGSGNCIKDFAEIDTDLGTEKKLIDMAKRGRRKGFHFVMELDLTQADPSWSSDPNAFISDPTSKFENVMSRDGKSAWSGKVMRTPRSFCNSLNISDAAVQAKLKLAISKWLDRGLSGFLLTNVAYLGPIKTNVADPLFSKQGVQFVQTIRQFIDREADNRGRPIALFVDLGDIGYMASQDKLNQYTASAHAVVHTGLGKVLAKSNTAAATTKDLANSITDVLATADVNATWLHASNWPYLMREPSSVISAILLSLPGVPVIYYGQEIGMSHVGGVKFDNGSSSYLSGINSTDQSETPMQWSGPSASAGWLPNKKQQLKWVNLTARSKDIELQNLRRLSSAGHPTSPLQLVQQLVAMVKKFESLQWGKGELLWQQNDILALRRKATRFPSVLLIVSKSNISQTLALPTDRIGEAGVLEFIDSAGADCSYEQGLRYQLFSLYVPPSGILVFVGEDFD